jgi:hypothetical protein
VFDVASEWGRGAAMIFQDVSRNANAQGRCAGSFRDGQFTRYIEVIQGVIVITSSDSGPGGQPVELHRNQDLVGLNFQPLAITTTRSGFDGKLIVTFGGFTPSTNDSRRISVKTDLVIKEPGES